MDYVPTGYGGNELWKLLNNDIGINSNSSYYIGSS